MRHTVIIAEAGVNHNGSTEMAKKLVDAAAEAGADYVKFQTFKSANLVLKNARAANYQRKNMQENALSQYQMLKNLELTYEDHVKLIEYANSQGIKFLSTAFDLESVQLLANFHLGLWKIPSGEITNYPYLRLIAQQHEPVILSTGMSTMEEIESAVRVLLDNGLPLDYLTILHCNTEYPTPMCDVNLRAMNKIASVCHTHVGYSDHTLGIEVPIAAVALGASVIEKHFTLDRSLQGPDHKASLEPQELKNMVTAIRNVEVALGSPEKKVTDSEEKNKLLVRKSIVALKEIKEGDLFSEDNLTVKRPGNGISAIKWLDVIGKKSPRNFKVDEIIEL